MENRTPRARRAAARRVLRARTRTHRAAARIARRGVGTLATYAVAAGLPVREARSAAGTMRKCAARLGVEGTAGVSYAGRAKARACRRYTPAEAAQVAADYARRARKAAYKAMAVRVVRAGLEVAA
ncbi:hypothetical protein OG880_33275 (plasmid) [Streptomyces cellulosae]|uniref:hypothetical protein n=1 Tax=Streptomyces cellulosae TaxID=1968 RepID=UPI002ED28631|nr:hypothetical protein OG880_33275 [Streptomyces cellulosae]